MAQLVFTCNNVDFLLSHRKILVEGARAQGYEVAVVGPRGPACERLHEMRVPFYRWELSRSGQHFGDEALTVAQLVSIYRQVKPDLVHHVTVKPVLYGSVAARLAGVHGVVNAVSGLGYVFLAGGLRAEARRRGIAAAYRVATSIPNSRVILQNDDDEADLRRLYALGSAPIVKIRGSGVDLKKFPETPEPEGTPTVVLPARMLRDKGVVEFAEAARILKHDGVAVRMVLVGGLDPGNPAALPESEVRGWVKDEIVEWWGHQSAMPEVLKQAHIVCLPSYREGLPRALLEAGAIGRAIITTNVPGCRDVVDGGRLGVLVPAKDPRALAAAVRGLVTDHVRRRALGKAMAAHARDTFGEDRVLQQHLEVYAALLQR